MGVKIIAEDDGFRTFAVDPPYAARTLKLKLTQRINELAAQIIDGYATDWADYRHRTGEIEGLRNAVRFCDDMEKSEKQ